MNGYSQYRSPIALVRPPPLPTASWLIPGRSRTARGMAACRCRPIRMPTYASVFYSPYQLLALKPVEQLIRKMSPGTRTRTARPLSILRPLTPGEAAALDGSRQLAVLLSALDMHYLPRILLTAYHATPGRKKTRIRGRTRGWRCSALSQRPRGYGGDAAQLRQVY